jgi:hypothetical protein
MASHRTITSQRRERCLMVFGFRKELSVYAICNKRIALA